ncbi:MAG: hypothetical protein ABIJ09_08680 [Pseudomonadota bacterium]
MKKEEVRELTRQFVAALEEEKEIRTKLLELKMLGSDDEVRRNLQRHDAMIDSIKKLREQKMLPIIDKLGAFIADKAGTNRTPQQRLRDAIGEGKQKVAEKRLHSGMPGTKKAPATAVPPAAPTKEKKTKAKK